MLKSYTPAVTEMLNSCLIETSNTRKFQNLDWHPAMKLITFRTSSSMSITTKELQDKIDDYCEKLGLDLKTEKMNRAITVRMLNLGWIMQEEN